MKLFVLTSRIPFPLEKGDKLRIFNQLKRLSKSHKIYLCSTQLPNTKVAKESKEVLLSLCEEVHFIKLSYMQILISLLKAIFNNDPFQTALFYDLHAQSKITQLISEIKPDHLYCQLTRVAKYIAHNNTRKTLDYMDAFSKGMERRANKSHLALSWFYKWEARKQEKYESQMMDLFENHTIITKEDRSFINHQKKMSINIISNGVDFEYFKPCKRIIKYDLVFVGNMSYAPNIDAVQFLCNDILPIIKIKIPKIKILIAGAYPSKSVLKLESRNITVSGWMEDIREAYAMSKVFIAPMRMGTGLQNKLLEAMSMNKACITTNIANKGLSAPVDAIYAADNAQELADYCIKILTDKVLRNELERNAHLFVKNKYSWDKTTNDLDKILKE